MNDEKTIIEINGVKMEVDLREAKQISCYKVGDPVRVLIKKWSDEYCVFDGVIIDFALFQNLPTITVAYLDDSEIKYAHINSNQKKNAELAPAINGLTDAAINKGMVLDNMQRNIDKKLREIQDLETQREVFLSKFGRHFNLESESLQ